MIKYISIKNFKCFEDLELSIANLTLITGVNGAGKSSITQALLLLRQSNDDKRVDLHSQVKIDGDLTDLIDADSMRYAYSEERDITIGITNDEEEVLFCLKDAVTRNKEIECQVTGNLDKALDEWPLFDKDFVYLYAERTAPQRNYKKDSGSNTDSRLGDKHGHQTAFRLYQSMDEGEELPVPALKLEEAGNDYVKDNVSAWINRIMGSNISVSTTQESPEQVRIDYTQEIKGDAISLSPLNVAFGHSYLLPIVVGILTAPKGSLVIIENPEAHLHPSAQFRVGELLAVAAESGIQLIVETHSDHLLNGIRCAVKLKKLDAEKVEIHYIEQDAEDASMHTDNRVIMEADGTLDHWPKNFFDEWESALRLING